MAVTSGRIAASRPANTTEAELHAPASGEEITATLTIVNQTGSSATFRVALTDAAGAAAAEDWLAYDEPLAAYSRMVIPIACKNPETVRIQSGTADAVSFMLAGMVKT